MSKSGSKMLAKETEDAKVLELSKFSSKKPATSKPWMMSHFTDEKMPSAVWLFLRVVFAAMFKRETHPPRTHAQRKKSFGKIASQKAAAEK